MERYTHHIESIKDKWGIVEIYGTYNLGIIETLKRELKQDTILVVNNFLEVNFK